MPQTTQQDPEASREHQGGNPANKPSKHWLKRPSTWTCVFTGVLVVTTIQQCRANTTANRIADITNDTAQRAQRAFVTFVGTAPQMMFDPSRTNITGISVKPRWENQGVTPTRNFTSHVSWMPMGNALPPNYVFQDLGNGKPTPFVMGPRGSMTMTGAPIMMANIDAINAGTQFYYLWGWGEYRDTFPGTPLRLAEFCIQITGIAVTRDPDVLKSSAQVTWTHCGHGNCYDEDCPDYQQRANRGQPQK